MTSLKVDGSSAAVAPDFGVHLRYVCCYQHPVEEESLSVVLRIQLLLQFHYPEDGNYDIFGLPSIYLDKVIDFYAGSMLVVFTW